MRKRLLRGSSDVQTAQEQPSTGTPVDVPQPNIVTLPELIARFSLFARASLALNWGNKKGRLRIVEKWARSAIIGVIQIDAGVQEYE